MTTTVSKTTTIYDAFMDVFAMDARDQRWNEMPEHIVSMLENQDYLFEGTASELLEIIAWGNPDDLPANATRMGRAFSEIEPRVIALAKRSDYLFFVCSRILLNYYHQCRPYTCTYAKRTYYQ